MARTDVGAGQGAIFMDDVDCYGGETNLARCNHNGFQKHNCGHQEDVGVLCFGGT